MVITLIYVEPNRGVHRCPLEGNFIAAMPGAFLLSAPVILLFGGMGGCLCSALGWLTGDSRLFWDDKGPWSTCSACWRVLHCAGRGAHRRDHPANLRWVCVPLVLLLKRSGRKASALPSLLLGIAMSGVVYSGCWFPVLARFHRSATLAEMVKPSSATVLGFVLVTLPLVL